MWTTAAILGLLAGAAVLVAFGFVVGYLTRAARHPDFMADIVDFHEKFELAYDGPPRVLPRDLADFRLGFEDEELAEYKDVEAQLRAYLDDKVIPLIRKQNKVDDLLELQLDALVDLTYVVLGHAYLQFGPDVFIEAWERVHHANMQKVRKVSADAGHTDSGRAAKYDVVKPAGWQAPSHLDLIQLRHGPTELERNLALQHLALTRGVDGSI